MFSVVNLFHSPEISFRGVRRCLTMSFANEMITGRGHNTNCM